MEERYVLYVARHSLGAHVACGTPNKHESRLLRCLGKLPVPSLPFLTGIEKDPTRNTDNLRKDLERLATLKVREAIRMFDLIRTRHLLESVRGRSRQI